VAISKVNAMPISYSKKHITASVLEKLGLEGSKSYVKKYIPLWWINCRHNTRSFRLTEMGYRAFSNANLSFHNISVADNVTYNNTLILRLDRFLWAPYFFNTSREIIVFDDQLAVELLLFSGDLHHYTKSKIDSKNIG
jgi:hypothetical protein